MRSYAFLLGITALCGCLHHNRVEAVRFGYAHRQGRSWGEAHLAYYEAGPGGERAQSMTVSVAPRMLSDFDTAGRIELGVQVRAHLFRTHRRENTYVSYAGRWNPNDPNLRRVRHGSHWDLLRYEGRWTAETFAVGFIAEGFAGAAGRLVRDRYPDGHSHSRLADLRPSGGFSAGAFARVLTPWWIAVTADGGVEHVDGVVYPYFRAGLSLALDGFVLVGAPRLPR